MGEAKSTIFKGTHGPELEFTKCWSGIGGGGGGCRHILKKLW